MTRKRIQPEDEELLVFTANKAGRITVAAAPVGASEQVSDACCCPNNHEPYLHPQLGYGVVTTDPGCKKHGLKIFEPSKEALEMAAAEEKREAVARRKQMEAIKANKGKKLPGQRQNGPTPQQLPRILR